MNELTMYLNSGLAIMAFALIVIIVLLFMVYNLCQEREELKHSIESGVSSQPQNPRKPAMKNEDLKVSFGIGDEVQQLGQDRIPGNNVFTPPATVHPTQRLSAYMVNFYHFVPGESPDTVRRVRHSQVMYGYDYDQILLQVNAFRVQVGLTEFRPEGLIVQHLTTL